jgi:hypothetical protein
MGPGIELGGDRTTIRDNEVTGTIAIEGDRNLVTQNRAKSEFGSAIAVRSGDRNLVRANQVSKFFNATPSLILIAEPASRTSVVSNSAVGGDGDGIRVESAGTFIRGNTANDNGALGINAVDGVIDGGGNHASGNGDPRQCVGVVCAP